MEVSQNHYAKNIDFWETAWKRVKKASLKIPEVLDYIPDIPKSFQDHNCKHILDIACGSGWLCYYLAEHGLKATGVDISETAIKLAEQVREERPDAEVAFTKGDMLDLNFPENNFDGILINAAFEHLDFKRGEQFLRHIKKFIKAEGIMFAVFDKVASGEKGVFDLLEDGTHQYKDEYRDGMFLRNYSDDELEELLAKHQWQVISLKKNKFESRIVVAKNEK